METDRAERLGRGGDHMRIPTGWVLAGAVGLVACQGQTGTSIPEPGEATGVGVASFAVAGPVPVLVQNTDANPVVTRPTGTTPVTGTVDATQSGAWNVGISGTPTVSAAQSGAWLVGVSGDVSLVPGTGVVAQQGGAPWIVSLTGTPAVSIDGTASVTVANVP